MPILDEGLNVCPNEPAGGDAELRRNSDFDSSSFDDLSSAMAVHGFVVSNFKTQFVD